MNRFYLLIVFLFGLLYSLDAQTSLMGRIKDDKDQTIIGATVLLFKDGVQKEGTVTDEFGNYQFSNIDPGNYNMQVTMLSFSKQIITNVVVFAGKSNRVDVNMNPESQTLDEVTITEHKVPLIEQDNTTQGTTVTAEQIKNSPLKNITAIASTSAGVSTGNSGDISIRGSRPGATTYIIDGVKVSGAYIPPNEVEQLQVITGGLEAQYGDVTGGVLVASTKGPSRLFSLYVDGETSKYLDAYGRTELNASTSGPIWKKDNKSIIGFRLAGRFIHHDDDGASFEPIRYIKESELKRIEANPVRRIGATNFNEAEFNTLAITEWSKARKNEQSDNLDLNGKLDFRLAPSMSLQLGGGFTNSKNRFAPSRQWAFANYENNPFSYFDRYRANARFRHRLGNENIAEKGFIQNVSYTLIGGYEKEKSHTEDYRHKDKIFDYGYVGQFHLLDSVPLTFNTATERWEQATGFVTYADPNNPLYTPGSQNPILSNFNNSLDSIDKIYPQTVFNNNGSTNSTYNSIHNIYSNVGRVYNTYNKAESDDITGRVDIGFDLVGNKAKSGRHNILLGFLYQQNVERSYNLAPSGLWTLANQLANTHFGSLDSTSVRGNWTDPDGNVVTLYNPTVENSSGSLFYKKLREKLGVPLTDVVHIPNLTPDQLSLDMFSAEELYRNSYINFYGYDYLGNKVTNANFNDFFTDTIAGYNNVKKFTIAPFTPSYQSFYLQDKFQAKDVIFRIGLRIERYDANTKVMNDQYSLYPILTAKEFYAKRNEEIPTNINPDSKVYTSSASTDGTAVVYRLEDTWFDKNGIQTNTPFTSNADIHPAFKLENGDPVLKPDISRNSYDPNRSFRDYIPQVTFSPRIAISFPISKDANFFGHYDILVQRPNAGNYANPFQFYLWETATDIPNPDLKPEKTIDYEVGFQQALGEQSALKLSVYYKEIRDLIQSTYLNNTANNTGRMLTYRNIDFSTVKGLQLQYDLRRLGNVSLQANYTLQFADGTGSDPNTQRNIAKNGSVRILSPLDFDERHAFKLIMDFRYEDGKRYNGPVWFGADVFSNAGVNLAATAISGRPYTKEQKPEQFGSSGSIGTYNGARYPWNYNLDLRIDKSFYLNKSNVNHQLPVTVYVRITNLLNTRNVFGLYKATSSPDDDGYLKTIFGQAAFRDYEVNDVAASQGRTLQEYVNTYNWLMYNPGFFNGPRRIYLGLNFNF